MLKKLLTKTKVSKEIGKVEVKLIFLSAHYNFFEIMGVVAISFIYSDNTYLDDITSYFLCESTAGSDCRQFLSGFKGAASVLIAMVVVWLLTPVVFILCKINIFKKAKTCLQKRCSKKTRERENSRSSKQASS